MDALCSKLGATRKRERERERERETLIISILSVCVKVYYRNNYKILD
jgi:hypothetical protein